MSKSVVFSVRVDSEVKTAAAEVFTELGLSLNAGIDIYLRAVARSRAVPFPLNLEQADKVAYHLVSMKGGDRDVSND